MRAILTIIFFFTIGASMAQETTSDIKKVSTVVIEVEGMACQEGCADKISANLNDAIGVSVAEVSYEAKEAIVEFDPNLINLDGIKAIITGTKVKEYIYTIGKTTLKE